MRKEDYDLIERYLWGELNETEVRELENRRAVDSDFEAAIEEEIQLKGFLQTADARKSLQQNTQKLGAQFFGNDDQSANHISTEEKPQKKRPIKQINTIARRWIYAVAAAAILIGFSLLTWLWAFPPSAQELYQTYAVHYPINITDRATADESIQEIEAAFNQGDYTQASVGLENYFLQNTADNEVLLYLGITKLETGSAEEALLIFESLAAGSSLFKEEGTWYKALAFLKMEQVDQAKETLLEIPRESRRYASARKLYRKL